MFSLASPTILSRASPHELVNKSLISFVRVYSDECEIYFLGELDPTVLKIPYATATVLFSTGGFIWEATAPNRGVAIKPDNIQYAVRVSPTTLTLHFKQGLARDILSDGYTLNSIFEQLLSKTVR